MKQPLPLQNISEASLKALSPEDLLTALQPLLSHAARSGFIYGLDDDDKLQEYALVAWQCQQNYHPTPGATGKESSFINYLQHALAHRAASLAEGQNRRCREAVVIVCAHCGAERQPLMKYCVCGRIAARPVWGHGIKYLAATPDNPGEEDRGVPEPATADYHAIEDAEPLALVWGMLQPSERGAFLRALDTGKLRTSTRKRLQRQLAEEWSVYSSRRLDKLTRQSSPLGAGEK